MEPRDPGFAHRVGMLAFANLAVSAAARCFLDGADWHDVHEYDRRLGALLLASGAAPLPVRFVADHKPVRRRGRPAGPVASLYDGRIALEGVVPTRPRSWHDFLNALVWATFPRSKAALHRRQFAMIMERVSPAAAALPNARTREQDAIAMIDEGGVLLACAPATLERLMAALEAKDDDTVAVLVAQGAVQLHLFGHALYEHLVAYPDRSVRGYPLVMPIGADAALGALDANLATAIDDRAQHRKPHGLRGVLAIGRR